MPSLSDKALPAAVHAPPSTTTSTTVHSGNHCTVKGVKSKILHKKQEPEWSIGHVTDLGCVCVQKSEREGAGGWCWLMLGLVIHMIDQKVYF